LYILLWLCHTVFQQQPFLPGGDMPRIQSWEVSEAFWEKVAPLIPLTERNPNKSYKRKAGGGRKPTPPRRIFEGILYVLRTRCQWKALPKERFGSPSAVHAHFLRWAEAGFFVALWQAGLAEYDDMEGITWSWQSIDGAMAKAPKSMALGGQNPTDRGEKGNQTQLTGGRPWCPAVDRRDRGNPL
jgi:transposase